MTPSKIKFFFSLLFLSLVSCLVMPGTAEAGSDYWWDHHWGKRQLIGSTGTNSAYTTSHYLYITIDTSNSSDFQTDCDDLRIVYQTSTTQTEIGRTVSGCTRTTGSNYTKVYFQAQASIDANTDIDTLSSVYYVYYKNSAASAPSTTYTNTNFPQAPYTDDANALGLYHMEDENTPDGIDCTTNEICDSGGSGQHFDLMQGSENWTSGRIGYEALDCAANEYDTDATDSVTDVDYDQLAITTMDVWVHRDAESGSQQSKFMGSGDAWEVRTKQGNNFVSFDFHIALANTTVIIATCNVSSAWQHLRMVVNDTDNNFKAWCNGTADPAQTNFTFTSANIGTTMGLCHSTTDTTDVQRWDGQIDEMRISNTDRGAPDWVATEITTSLNTAETARTRRIHLMQ